MTTRLLLLISCLAFSLTAAGAKRTPFQNGQTLFVRGEFDSALRSLDLAATETKDPESLAQIHLLRGRCHAALGNHTLAEEAFGEALRNDPNASLDPNRVDPTVVQLLEDVRSKRAPKAVSGPSTANPAPVSDQAKPKTPRLVSKTRFFTDLRGIVTPTTGEDPLALEIGGGIASRFVRLGLSTRVAPQFGVTLRAVAAIPIAKVFQAYAQGEVPTLFLTHVAFGLGGGAGAEYFFSDWVSAFTEIGGRYFFTGRTPDNSQISVQAGARIWLP